MDQDRDQGLLNFLWGLFLGALLGGAVALLSAPRSGRVTRKRLRRAAGDLRDSAQHHLDELADEVKLKVDEVIKGARSKAVRSRAG
ncbi:MAG TPA: YtxH domain-containing protein [Longimicrobiales bacterium]|nr:YtxH domain-containing protein [Longimicrobiales bacterium]